MQRAVILSCSWLLTVALHESWQIAMTESDVIVVECDLAKACLARFRGVAYTTQDAEPQKLALDLKGVHVHASAWFLGVIGPHGCLGQVQEAVDATMMLCGRELSKCVAVWRLVSMLSLDGMAGCTIVGKSSLPASRPVL